MEIYFGLDKISIHYYDVISQVRVGDVDISRIFNTLLWSVALEECTCEIQLDK